MTKFTENEMDTGGFLVRVSEEVAQQIKQSCTPTGVSRQEFIDFAIKLLLDNKSLWRLRVGDWYYVQDCFGRVSVARLESFDKGSRTIMYSRFPSDLMRSRKIIRTEDIRGEAEDPRLIAKVYRFVLGLRKVTK